MKSLAEQEGKTERVFLVGVELKQGNAFDVNESMAELAELATTAGATIIGEGTQKLDRPHVATFIGKGKAGEFADLAKQGGRIAAGRLAIVAHAVADWLDGHAEQRRTA